VRPPTSLFWVLLVTVGVFAPVLGADFLWDDEILVTRNLWTDDVAHLPQFFTESLWDSTPVARPDQTYYRPMMLVELLVDRQLFGLAPLPHHLHSLLWHLGCIALVWQLFTGLWGRTVATVAATGVYALHPFQAELVAFTAARNDSMAIAGILGALLFLRERDPGPGRLVGATLCTLYALLSKETALLLPALLAGMDWIWHGRPNGRARYGALAGGIAIFGALRLSVSMETPPLAGDWGAWGLMAGSYVSRIAWPVGISATTPMEAMQVAPGSLVLGVIALAVAFKLGGRESKVGVAWFAGGLIPAAAGILVYGGLPFRYAALSLVGVSLSYGACWKSRPMHLGSLAAPVLLAAATVAQLPVWASTASLWEHGHRVSPGTHTACGLFKAYEAELNDTPRSSREWPQKFQQADAMLLEALATPPSAYCCFSASRWPWQLGLVDETLEKGRLALERGCPPSAELLAPLSMAEALSGNWEEAMALASGVESDPTGLVPVVLSAAALRKGDSSVLQDWEERGAGGATLDLRAQVEMILSRSGSTPPNSSASPTGESPPP